MKILITGGAGYIGQSLIKTLVAQKESEIVIYDNLSRSNYNLFFSELPDCDSKKIDFIHGELLNGRKLEQALKGVDVVYHLAAKVTTPFADLDSHFFEQVNHWGTAELVSAVEKSQVKHFIYLSSISVYGHDGEWIDENMIPRPSSFYAISKLRGEKQVERLISKLEKVHIIRAGNVYGYNGSMRMDAVINRFMFEANFNHRISVHGDGQQLRAFVHVDKLSYLLAQLLKTDVPSRIYNLVEHNLTVNQINEALRELYPDLEALYINQHIQMFHIRAKIPCKILQYIPLPEKSFVEELREFKNHFSF